jgi:hypothetical protein
MAVHAGLCQESAEAVTCFILTAQAQQDDYTAQCRKIDRYIAGAASSFFYVLDADNRNGCFRRDARGRTMPVAIQHKVTGDKDAAFREVRKLHEFERLSSRLA